MVGDTEVSARGEKLAVVEEGATVWRKVNYEHLPTEGTTILTLMHNDMYHPLTLQKMHKKELPQPVVL